MKHENELAMIVAFYLSKFGAEGLDRLGFSTYKQAFEEVGRSLNVKPNSVKNWRDEFDPYYDNQRKGWYQRGIRPSRQKILIGFDDLSEQALRSVVVDIMNLKARPKVEAELRATLEEVKSSVRKRPVRSELDYIARGVTGRRAEEFFIAQFRAMLTPFDGLLNDRRDEGVGYDFEVLNGSERALVEIKGLANESGGISFTDKEWQVACRTQESYFLGVVSNLSLSPTLGFVQNPARQFDPIYHAYTTVDVTWRVNAQQIVKAILK